MLERLADSCENIRDFEETTKPKNFAQKLIILPNDRTHSTQSGASVEHSGSAGWAMHSQGGDGELAAPGGAAGRAVVGGSGARAVRHVHLVQGGNYYGFHLGPFPTPAWEDQSRSAVTNFYHAQQDVRGEPGLEFRLIPRVILHLSQILDIWDT